MLFSLLISNYNNKDNNNDDNKNKNNNSDDNFNNFTIIICSIIIAFLNIIIEAFVTIIMSFTIPIEKTFCKINIGNFIDLSIILFKSFSFLFIFIMNKCVLEEGNTFFNDNNIYNKSTLLILISIIYTILEFIIFYYFDYNINYTSLTRIMNKITYEKQ